MRSLSLQLSVIFLLISLHSSSQVPTSATGRQILMETAATSASQPQTRRGCVAAHMAWSCHQTNGLVWRTFPMSHPHCSAGPTLSPVATANASQTATDAMVLMIAMTTVMKSTVALIVMHFFFFNLVDYIIPHKPYKKSCLWVFTQLMLIWFKLKMIPFLLF